MKETFLFYKDWHNVIRELPSDIRLDVYDAVMEYALFGKQNDLKPMAKIAFSFIKQTIDRDAEKYMSISKLRSEAGKKGSDKKWQTIANDSKNSKCHLNDNDNDNVNVSSVANATAQTKKTVATVAIEARRDKLQDEMRKYANQYSREMLNAFYQYWSEPNQKNTKMRFELEKTWLLSSRLATWEERENNYKKNSYGKNFTNTAKLSNETIRNIVESNDAGSFGEK